MYLKIVNARVDILNKSILEQVNMEIKDKDHIAIIGRNGAGKTTLLKALVDNTMFEEGTGEEKFNIYKVGNPVIGYLEQNEGLNNDNTLLEEILLAYQDIIKIEDKLHKLEIKLNNNPLKEEIYQYTELQDYYKKIGGYEYKKEYLNALLKNGFTENDFNKKISSFSGGEQTKISFIKLLLSKPDLLVLDEPTNHLDIEAILWLEEYLENYNNAFVVVSHDRMFINHVANKIYEIEYGEMILYNGNYEYYEEEKKKRYEINLYNYERYQKEVKRLQSIADRFRYKPSKASMAMAKLKQIERMDKVFKPDKADTKTFKINFPNFLESGKVVLSVLDLKFGYKYALGKTSFTWNRGDRLGVIGANGSGKSTLLKTIMGIIPKIGGSYSMGINVIPAYYDQQFSTFLPQDTVYEAFKKEFPLMNDYEIRSSLARFLFGSEDIDKKIMVLSGGEKVRLQLAIVVFKKANLLILDEPTNHLDILSKEKLEDVLKSYPGTIIFVSHDRYFVKKIATSILELEDNNVKYYAYNYEEYLEKKRVENSQIKAKKESRDNKKIAVNIDIKITKIEKEIASLKEKLFLEEVYLNQVKYQEIEGKIRILEDKLNRLLKSWE